MPKRSAQEKIERYQKKIRKLEENQRLQQLEIIEDNFTAEDEISIGKLNLLLCSVLLLNMYVHSTHLNAWGLTASQ